MTAVALEVQIAFLSSDLSCLSTYLSYSVIPMHTPAHSSCIIKGFACGRIRPFPPDPPLASRRHSPLIIAHHVLAHE